MIGAWDETNKKELPGVYNAFSFKAQDTIQNGTGGVLAMPVKANWGPVGKFISIKDKKDLREHFGDDETYSAVKLGKLALLGNPKEILMCRIANENAACSKLPIKDTASDSAVTVIEISSLYPTDRDFNITIRENIGDSEKKDLILFEGTKPILSFTALPKNIDTIVNTINSHLRNKYIRAEKKADSELPLADIVNQKLTGGNNGLENITNEDYVNVLSEFERVNFNKFVLDGVDEEELNTTIKSWIDTLRSKGRPVSSFLGSKDSVTHEEINNKSINMNHEGIVHVNIKGTLNGKTYTRAESAIHIAALACSIGIKDSLCNMKTSFNDVEYMSEEEQIEAINSGTLVCYKDQDGDVLILDDVNTLDVMAIDENSHKGEYLRYIRTVDFIDTVDTDIKVVCKKYKGKMGNNTNGQIVVSTAFKKYFEEYVANQIIEPSFVVAIDEELQFTAKKDEFYWKWSAEHIGVMKKIYGTGYVK